MSDTKLDTLPDATTGFGSRFPAWSARSNLAVGSFILLLHILGWGVLVATCRPQQLQISSGPGAGHRT
jgi:hypothetical protein